jgi:hypothetical protein
MHVGTVSDLSDEKIVEMSLFPLELPPGKTVTGDKVQGSRTRPH